MNLASFPSFPSCVYTAKFFWKGEWHHKHRGDGKCDNGTFFDLRAAAFSSLLVETSEALPFSWLRSFFFFFFLALVGSAVEVEASPSVPDERLRLLGGVAPPDAFSPFYMHVTNWLTRLSLSLPPPSLLLSHSLFLKTHLNLLNHRWLSKSFPSTPLHWCFQFCCEVIIAIRVLQRSFKQ